MRKIFIFLVALIVLGLPQSSYALLNNPGFETGDLTGWTADTTNNGSAQVVTSHDSVVDVGGTSTTYNPVEGSYFALLTPGDAGVHTTLSQSFSIGGGMWVEGWVAFDAGDYMPYNDNAWVQILNGSGGVIATPLSIDVLTVGGYGETPWTYWRWDAPAAGTYTLKFGVANVNDSGYDSYGLLDANQISSASAPGYVIPEPATISLLSISLLGLLGLRRKKKFCM